MSDSKLVFGKDDKLFGSIEEMQGRLPFGRFLDAGTGVHSVSWIASLFQDTERYGISEFTAVTADTGMQRNVQQRVDELGVTKSCRVVKANWMSSNSELESLGTYDTVLADYLVGAMDGFSPYTQDLIFGKLKSLLKPGGRLYIIGLEPIPDSTSGIANIICKVRQVRDACILLAGHRCYREYPKVWVERQLDLAGFKRISSEEFPILYSHQTIERQINVGRRKIPFFATEGLKQEMKTALDMLSEKSKEATGKSPGGRINFGFDYIITAEKAETW